MSYSPQAFNTATSTSLGEVKIGSGFTLAGDGTLNNGGVTQLTGAATIKVSAATGPITITDVGVFSVTGGTGITTNVTTGSVTVTNAGVTSNLAGTGISVSGATGAVTITNTGVTAFNGSTGNVFGVGAVNGSTGSVLVVSSIAGTSNQITASASTGAVTLSLPQSIATTSAVTFNTATISSGNIFAGSGATSARFPSALIIASTTAGGIQQNETTTNIGIMGEAVGANAGNYGVGVYGAGYSAGNARGTGVTGEGHVSATGDTASAIGVRGYSNDTHAGGLNVGLFGDASGSAIGNYALYMNTGNIYSGGSQTWYLNGNLTFNTGIVTVPNLTATNLTVTSSLEIYTSPAISSNAVTLNFLNGNTFALASNAAAITANYTNVPTTTGQVISTALIITQGSTAYIPSAVTINTVSQTIKWQGGSPPTGNANKTDIVSFTFICNGTTTPTVIGSLSTYG